MTYALALVAIWVLVPIVVYSLTYQVRIGDE